MHVHALVANAIIVLATNAWVSYAAPVSVTSDAVPPAAADAARDAAVAAWRELAACHAAVSAALERELGDRHGLCVSDFEVLERLAESPERKSRAQDLAEAVHLSQSALSRLVDRLAKTGLVQRCACDLDRRGVDVVLTDVGARRHDEAVPTHRDVLARYLPAR